MIQSEPRMAFRPTGMCHFASLCIKASDTSLDAQYNYSLLCFLWYDVAYGKSTSFVLSVADLIL